MPNFPLAASLALLLCTSSAFAQGNALEAVQINGASGVALDEQLMQYAAAGFSGTVLVVRDGRVTLLKGYGLAMTDIVFTGSTRAKAPE